MLILEGIEKAERNVLPTLSNLLEDRSMGLEDGRFIMKASGTSSSNFLFSFFPPLFYGRVCYSGRD